MGLKDLAKPSPFHIRPKAHAEEEEMPEDEQRESRLSGYTVEDSPVLGSISWQSGFPLFVLGHFFLLGMGLRPDMKWAGLYQILQPHNSPSKSCCPALRTERRVLMSSGLYHGRLSLIPLWAPGPLCLPKARSWRFDVRGALSSILLWDDANRFGIRNVYSMAPL